MSEVRDGRTVVASRVTRARSTADVARKRAALALGILALVVALAAFVVSGIAVAGNATAGTTITITPGACAGGGATFCFGPEAATAAAGALVTWTDQSAVAHEIAPCTSSACPGSPPSTGSNAFAVLVPANGHGSFTFTNPGSYYYYCTIHGYGAMHGRITITSPATPPPTPSSTPRPTPRPTRAPTPRPSRTAPIPSPVALSQPPAAPPATATSPATTPSMGFSPAPSATPSQGVGAVARSDISSLLPIAAVTIVIATVAAGGTFLALRNRRRRAC